MKIISEAPCRVDLAGSTLDIWPLYLYHPGAVTLNFAVDRWTRCVIEPREMPVYVRKYVPEMTANSGLHMWYRYLNCGFRLTATAGTDKMTTFVTVGANRVYAHVDGEFTYQSRSPIGIKDA